MKDDQDSTLGKALGIIVGVALFGAVALWVLL